MSNDNSQKDLSRGTRSAIWAIITFDVVLILIYTFFIVYAFIKIENGGPADITYVAVISTVTISIVLSSVIPYFISRSEIFSVEDRIRSRFSDKFGEIDKFSEIQTKQKELEEAVSSLTNDVSAIREQDQKSSDAHVSRIASYLLMSNQDDEDSLWAVGWSARALRGYGDVIEAGNNGDNGAYLEFVNYCFTNMIVSYTKYLQTLIKRDKNPLDALLNQYSISSRIRERSIRLLRDLYYVDQYYESRVSQFADIPGYTEYFKTPLSYYQLRKGVEYITIICVYTLATHYSKNGSDFVESLVSDAFGSRSTSGDVIRDAQDWVCEYWDSTDDESILTYSNCVIEMHESLD